MITGDPFNFEEFINREQHYGISVRLLPTGTMGEAAVTIWLKEQFGNGSDALEDKVFSQLPDESVFGFYTREKLDFLRSFLKKADFLPFIKHCGTVYRFFSAVDAFRTNINRIAIFTSNSVFQIDDKPHIISYSRVIEELLKTSFPRLNATITQEITLPRRTRMNTQYELLLLELQ